MSVNVEQQAADVIYRSAQILIMDQSGTVLNVNTYAITGGVWDPANQPVSGQQITPGENTKFVNYTDQPYTSIGGVITLVPQTGGTISVTWSWPYGSPFTQSVSTQSTTLTANGTIVGQTGTQATVQVQITGQ
jgi:hypothetical protein